MKAFGEKMPSIAYQMGLSNLAVCFIKVHMEKSKGRECSKMEVTAFCNLIPWK